MVSDLIVEKRAESVADVGCGDHAIGRAVLDRLEQGGYSVGYTGYDLVANLIRHHNEHYASPTVRFVRLNIVEKRLPNTDFTMVREVFQHLRNAEVRSALEHIACSCRWAVVTESHYDGDDFVPNLDLPSEGTLTRSIVRSGIDLTEPPFGLRGELILEAPGKHCVLKTLLIDFDRQVAE